MASNDDKRLYRINKEMDDAGIVRMRQNQAMYALEKTSYETTRFAIYLIITIIGSASIWIALKVYALKQAYADFITWIDGTCRLDGFTVASGLRLVLAFRWGWFNRLFGSSANITFPAAAIMSFNNNIVKSAIDRMGRPGQFLMCLWYASITTAGSNESTMKIICKALCAMDATACSQDCLQPCPDTDTSQSTAIAAAQGATSGLSMGAGAGFLFHAALGSTGGPIALGCMAVGALINTVASIDKNNREKKRSKIICQTNQEMQICRTSSADCSS